MNKLNKHGQSLIMFVLFLPVFLMAFALIVDVGLMYHAKIRGNSILSYAKKENLNIKDYFALNNIDIKNFTTSSNNEGSCVIINYNIDSVFGSLVGYKSYDIQVSDC